MPATETVPAIETDHAVHLEPEYRTERLKTFDPKRGDTKKPAGEDVTPEHTYHEVDPVKLTVKVVTVPEVRIPYWEFDDTMRIDQTDTCPDCGHGLVADDTDKDFGPFLRCVNRAADKNDPPEPRGRPCHTGCLVACGLE